MKLSKVSAAQPAEYPSFLEYRTARQRFLKAVAVGLVGVAAAVPWSNAAAQDTGQISPTTPQPTTSQPVQLLGIIAAPTAPSTTPTPPEAIRLPGEIAVAASPTAPPQIRGEMRAVIPPRNPEAEAK